MNIIVACKTIHRELENAITDTSCTFPIIWVDPIFHESPKQLHEVLQKTLDQISNVDHVLLCFGFCGNALLGLVPHGFKLVFPKVDDCITLLLGSTDRRKELEPHSYFFTPGWLGNNKSILTEYEDIAKQYGEESADYVYEVMLCGYHRALLVDTHVGDIDAVKEMTRPFSEKFNLSQEIIEGDTRMFHQLLGQEWDENFVVIQPEEAVSHAHLFGIESTG
ncbi:MAG: DUF1638 domain-containing protein [Synergistaceae bacterium]|jgi:hypothetical protein|nr:DUF1638 domain-containing protein [Synergistaceae bacterium]